MKFHLQGMLTRIGYYNFCKIQDSFRTRREPGEKIIYTSGTEKAVGIGVATQDSFKSMDSTRFDSESKCQSAGFC